MLLTIARPIVRASACTPAQFFVPYDVVLYKFTQQAYSCIFP